MAFCSSGCAHKPFTLSIHEIRPRACRFLRKKDLNIGDIVLANYNPENPSEFGYWYDFIIESVDSNLQGSILILNNGTTLENCTIKYDNCIMQIEKPAPHKEKLNICNESNTSMYFYFLYSLLTVIFTF